jgi:hypothetical protein
LCFWHCIKNSYGNKSRLKWILRIVDFKKRNLSV